MTKLSIVTVNPETPNTLSLSEISVLRLPSKEIDFSKVDRNLLKQVIEGMFEIIYETDGAGLAAPQIGLLWRLAVLDPAGFSLGPTVIINPKIVFKSEEEEKGPEICLSVPGYIGHVYRSSAVKVEAYDLQGILKTYDVEGFVARLFQHEIDHLDGILFPDRIRDGDELEKYNIAQVRAKKAIVALTAKEQESN